MKSNDPNPLEPDIIAILKVEKAIAEPSSETKDRLFNDLQTRIVVNVPRSDLQNRSSSQQHLDSKSWAIHGWRAGAAIVSAFIGGAVVTTLLPHKVRVVYVDRVIDAPPIASVAPEIPPASPSSIPVASLPLAPPTTIPTSRPAVSIDTSNDDPSNNGLAAERAVLDVARSALARGEPDAALDAVREHEKRYPHGMLVEEREALAVKALVMAHRGDEARARAAHFERQFPNGLMLPAVKSAIESIP